MIDKTEYLYRGVVQRVIDGDTVDILCDLGFHIFIKERFRLEGIDTPELRGGTTETKKLAQDAKKWLTSVLLDKEVLVLSKKQGKFGRYLGTIYLDEVDINQELIKLGHAKVYGS